MPKGGEFIAIRFREPLQGKLRRHVQSEKRQWSPYSSVCSSCGNLALSVIVAVDSRQHHLARLPARAAPCSPSTDTDLREVDLEGADLRHVQINVRCGAPASSMGPAMTRAARFLFSDPWALRGGLEHAHMTAFGGLRPPRLRCCRETAPLLASTAGTSAGLIVGPVSSLAAFLFCDPGCTSFRIQI